MITFRKLQFSTVNIENNYNKVYIAKNYVKNRVQWYAHFILWTFMIDTIKFWILDKNYTFFSDIYSCMDITMRMVREDILTTYFWSTWSRATNRIAHTSTERACQSKWWHKRMETKRNFPNHFKQPRFASGYDQNRLIISDVNKENKHRVVAKLMMTVPKWDKWYNQRKIDKSF